MSVKVHQCIWRCYLKFSCFNFCDFVRKCDAEEFIRNHPAGDWFMRKVFVDVPLK